MKRLSAAGEGQGSAEILPPISTLTPVLFSPDAVSSMECGSLREGISTASKISGWILGMQGAFARRPSGAVCPSRVTPYIVC